MDCRAYGWESELLWELVFVVQLASGALSLALLVIAVTAALLPGLGSISWRATLASVLFFAMWAATLLLTAGW